MISSLIISAKDKVVKNPVCTQGSPSLSVRSVTLGKTSTTVSFKYGGGGWTLAAEAHLEADGNTYRMTGGTVFTKKEDGTHDAGEALDPTKHYGTATDSLVLVFEPLAPGTKMLDFIEEEESSFNIHNIRLDGKLYPFVLGKPKPYPYAKDEALPAIKPQYGRAKYTVRSFKQDGSLEMPTMFGMNNKFSNAPYLDSEDYSYQIEASSTYSAPVGIPNSGNQFRIMMIPGYETTVLSDPTAYYAARAGHKIPRERIIQFEGPLADLQEVRYDHKWLYYDLQSETIDEVWTKTQNKIRSMQQNKGYSRRQREFSRLFAEERYLIHYLQFVRQGKVGLQDAHAGELQILRDGRSFYFVGDDQYLDYAHANGITGEVTEWMEGYRRAMNLARRMRNMELMPEVAFDTIPQLFQKELRAMNDSTRLSVERLRTASKEVRVMETPNCIGQEFIDMVVRENPGVVLFFDFWATWCGPCMAGIKAMEPLKEVWAGKPLRFVYVTNESSPFNQWAKQIVKMPGLHYRLPDSIWNAIPNLEGIPQYYIYDPQGNRFFEQTGFDGIEPLKQKIEEVLKQ